MSPVPTAFVHQWFDEVWNAHNPEAADNLMAPDAAMHGLGDGAGVNGLAAFKEFASRLLGAFPDIHVRIDQTIEEGDLIAARWTATMTHTGDQLGIAPTGQRVGVTGMSMARVRDGIMVEGWNNWDTMALMEQIGALHQGARLVPANA